MMLAMTRRTALSTLPVLLSACAHLDTPGWIEGQQAISLTLPGEPASERLWLSLPRGYLASAQQSQQSQAWPLVVFLHGSGERGEDLEAVKVHGPPKHAAQGRDYPFILASPQLAAGQRWSPERLHKLVAALRERLRIDADRVLATGLSLGGMGVWDWAAAYPDELAAIAPVCGFGDPAAVCRARLVPVRAYHGDADTVVPIAKQQACVDALRACGGRADFIVYPGEGHGSWNPAYDDAELVPWLMQQSRGRGRT
jgi:predicted peptidase